MLANNDGSIDMKHELADLVVRLRDKKLREHDTLAHEAADEIQRLRDLINSPSKEEWTKAVVIEAAHQSERWPAAQDAAKTPEDWFWLVGYLAGKCLASFKQGDMDKARHHTISTAAVCYQWSKSIEGMLNIIREDDTSIDIEMKSVWTDTHGNSLPDDSSGDKYMVICPTCNDANACGDYQGPACPTCGGEGKIALKQFCDGDGTMEVENPPPPTDKRCEGGGIATNGECLHCNAAMGETCREKDTIK
jgi:hypothetical protein